MMVLQKGGAAEGRCCRRMVLQKDGVAEGWCCRRMVLQKDGAAEGWCCSRRMVLQVRQMDAAEGCRALGLDYMCGIFDPGCVGRASATDGG